jgi:cytochrome b pre-mRNA-processing protein 3
MGLARSRLGRQESRVLGFLRRRRHERLGYELYGAAVAAARQPVFYSDLRVPDTLDGRFDLVGLHVFLVIRRLTALPPPGPDVAQAVFDAMFSDMDFNLREMGVSDLVVGRRVKAMWEALHGRSAAYEAAMGQEPAESALAEALARNVWRGAAPGAEMPGDAARRLARLVLRHAATLEAMPAEALLGGGLRFEAAEEALA